MRQVILLIVGIVALSCGLGAQTWQFRYGQPSISEQGAYIARTPDGGYLVRASVSTEGHSALIRLDTDGDTLWIRTLGPFGNPADPDDPPVEDLVLTTPAGEIYSVFYDQLLRFDAGGNLLQGTPTEYFRLLGLHTDGLMLYRGGIGQDTLRLRKYGFDGGLMWEKKHAADGDLFDVKMAPDGKIYALHLTSVNIFSAEGDFLTKHNHDSSPYGKIAFDATGNYILYETVLSDPQAPNNSFIARKSSPEGALLWQKKFTTPGKDAIEKIVPLPNGFLLLLGTTWGDPLRTPRLYLWDPNGNQVGKHEFQAGLDTHFSDAALGDGGTFVLTGAIGEAPGPSGSTDAVVWQVKPDDWGEMGLIRGRVVFDLNEDCYAQPSEPGLGNWKVRVNNNLIVVDDLGRFEAAVQAGVSEIEVYPPYALWEVCPGFQTVSLPGAFHVVNFDIPVMAIVQCPTMEVSVGFPRLRRCFTDSGTVIYRNAGTMAESTAKVLVVLPPELDFENADLPVSQSSGDSLWFDVGLVEPGAVGRFDIRVKVNCDLAVLGQTLCTEARIFPDTFCNIPPNWSGAFIVAEADCKGDTVIEFVLRNIGTAPTTPELGYIIIEDQVVLRTSKITDPLPPGGEMRFEQALAGGSLYRLEAEQEPNHPGLSMPAAWVEGCGGAANWGLAMQYPAADADPFVDIACLPVIGAYDPNDKAAHPEGYAAEHFIEPNTDLTYRIRFQNTGTDTAFTVIVRDTLSPWLDPVSVRPQAASHPYIWDFADDGNVLKFVFSNILLPDSFVNEPASNGFVEFRISQKADVPLSTVIRNDAAIFFDFNPPVITNEVFHTVGREFITVHVESPPPGVPGLRVFPNPFREAARFRFDADVQGQITLFSLQGKAARQEIVSGQEFVFQRNGLAAGLYFFEVRDTGGRLLARGKVVVQ